MITIPFANPLGANGGPLGDGVIYGVLPQVAPVTALSQIHLSPFTKVYRGNAAADGSVTWTNVTTAANNDTIGDVSLFDTVNPTADRICIELSAGDEIDGVSFLVSTAGNYAGAVAAIVRYKGTSGSWVTASAVITPALTSTGLKKVGFTAIKYEDVALTDDLLNPVSNPQMRCLFVEFSGITSVTAAPLFTRVWKNVVHSASHKAANFTTLVGQGANPDFSTAQASILPVTNDLTLFGFDEKPLRLFPTIYRPGNAGHTKEWVYSRTADFAALPAAAINDPSTRFEAALVGLAAARAVDFPNTTGVAVDVTAAPAITSSFSISVWLYRTGGASGNNTIVDVGSHSLNTGFGIWINVSFQMSLRLRNDYNHYRPAATLPLNEWAHVVATWDDTDNTVRFYLNGVLVDTQTGRTTNPTAATAMRFGRRDGASNERYVGRMDELQIYNTVLDQAAVTTLWNYGNGVQGSGSEAGIVAAWHFDETSGSTAAAYVGGTGFDGTIAVATPGAAVLPSWGASANTPQIALAPPPDWVKQSLTDTADVAHSRYWIGFRTTADTAAAVLPANFTMRAQIANGTSFVRATEAATYTTISVSCRDESLADSTLLVVNNRTKQVVSVTVTANANGGEATGLSFPVQIGDPIILTQAIGHPTVHLGDGFVQMY